MPAKFCRIIYLALRDEKGASDYLRLAIASFAETEVLQESRVRTGVRNVSNIERSSEQERR